MGLTFEWDENKNTANIRKPGIRIEEAITVFGALFARIAPDDKHSLQEQRWHIIGESELKRILIVAFTERNDGIRIITSRKASKAEKKKYEEIRKKRTS